MANPIDEDFVQFCRQATDSQLAEILSKEYAAHHHRDYSSALIAAGERSWLVVGGRVIGSRGDYNR